MARDRETGRWTLYWIRWIRLEPLGLLVTSPAAWQAQEFRHLEDKLGLTPAGLAALGWRIVDERPTVTRSSSRRLAVNRRSATPDDGPTGGPTDPRRHRGTRTARPRVPAELLDADHPVWRSAPARYRTYMRRHGWTPPRRNAGLHLEPHEPPARRHHRMGPRSRHQAHRARPAQLGPH